MAAAESPAPAPARSSAAVDVAPMGTEYVVLRATDTVNSNQWNVVLDSDDKPIAAPDAEGALKAASAGLKLKPEDTGTFVAVPRRYWRPRPRTTRTDVQELWG